MRKFLKLLIPPIIIELYRKFFLKKNFIRGFNNWNDALSKTTSYENKDIFSKTLHAARLVRDKKVAYERDSVIFNTIQYDWPLLSVLLLVANRQKKLNVVDFGGALGTTYRQNKKYLDALSIPLKWGIVEQTEYVKVGRSEFQDNILHFYESISSIEFDIDLIMLNGSLCYLESPYKILDQIKSVKPEFILFTRTPFTDLDKDDISIQIVPKSIYEASFPIWTFSESKIIGYLSDLYEIFEIWNDNLQADNNAVAKGILFKLIKS